jgi:hypothetical protein
MAAADRVLGPRNFGGNDSRATDYQANAVTGTTAETQVGQNFTVPGRAMGKNGSLEIEIFGTATNNANVKTVKVYFGGVVVATVAVTSASAYKIELVIGNRNSLASQIVTVKSVVGATVALATTTGTVNTNNDQTLKVTVTLATGTDTVQQEAIEVELESSDF